MEIARAALILVEVHFPDLYYHRVNLLVCINCYINNQMLIVLNLFFFSLNFIWNSFHVSKLEAYMYWTAEVKKQRNIKDREIKIDKSHRVQSKLFLELYFSRQHSLPLHVIVWLQVLYATACIVNTKEFSAGTLGWISKHDNFGTWLSQFWRLLGLQFNW